MRVTEKRTVAPVIEPITLTEAKANAIVETTDYDTLITRKIAAARDWVEQATGRALCLQTWRTRLDEFPHGDQRHGSFSNYLDSRIIRLNHPPLISVTSIAYIDTAGVSQTLAASKYVVDSDSEPARIQEAYSEEWPTTYPEINSITITSTHGYCGSESPLNRDLIPAAIREAVATLVTEMYERRSVSVLALDATILDNVRAQLSPYRIRSMLS